jgi:hypothetical protein
MQEVEVQHAASLLFEHYISSALIAEASVAQIGNATLFPTSSAVLSVNSYALT